MSSILTKTTWIFFGVTALGFVCGCHHIPSSQGGLGNTLGEYSVQDEEVLRQWQKAATGSNRELLDEEPSQKPNSEERFSFVKSLFKKDSSREESTREGSYNRMASRAVKKRPDHLEEPDLFPAENYKTPQIGRVVPMNRPVGYASSSTGTAQTVIPENPSRSVQFPPPPEVAATAVSQRRTLSSTLQPSEDSPLPENPSDFVAGGLMTTTQPVQTNASAEELLAPPPGPISSAYGEMNMDAQSEGDSSSIQMASYFQTAVEPVSQEDLIAKAQNSLPLVEVPLDLNHSIDLASVPYHPILEESYARLSNSADNGDSIPETPEEMTAAVPTSVSIIEPEKMLLTETDATPVNSLSLSDPSSPSVPLPLGVDPVILPDTSGVNVPMKLNMTAQELVENSPLAFNEHPSHPVAYEAARVAVESVKNLQNPTAVQSSEQWQDAVRQAVEQLRAEIDRQAAQGTLRPTEVARLQLLMLAVGDSPHSVEKVASTAPTLSKFWAGQCRGLKALLDTTEENCQDSVDTAARELSASLGTLQLFCPARIEKALFSESSAAFGLYQPHRGGYHPGDIAHVYLELGNIVSQPIGEEFEISLMCGWQLLDAEGNAVLEPAQQLCANRSASPLKDIVLNIPFQVPENLTPGDYQLVISICDHHADEPEEVQSVLKFKVL